MSKRKTTEQFKKEVYNFVGDEYEVIGEYINSKTHIKVRHNLCGYIWDCIPHVFLGGGRCPLCNGSCKTLTHDDFYRKVINKFGDEYEILTPYINHKSKIKIKHKICGREFEITPMCFMNSKGCRQCLRSKQESRIKSTEIFKNEVYSLVGDEYSVLENYNGCKNKILFTHNICNHKFYMSPDSFLQGSRCPHCAKISRTLKRRKNPDDFYKEAMYILGNEYSILDKYINKKTKIRVLHKVCGNVWNAIPDNILSGSKCPSCQNVLRGLNSRLSYDYVKEYIEENLRFKLLSKKYNGSNEKLKVQCSEGHIFNRSFNNFRQGRICCLECNESKGEKIIKEWLIMHNIKFKREYIFDDLFGIGGYPLRFDFAIFNNNTLKMLIEYDGEFHFNQVYEEFNFKRQKEHDLKKNDYCFKNKIKLLRIPYWEFDNIAKILEKELLQVVEG